MAFKRIKKITLQHASHIAFRLAREHLGFDEPIPDFSTRFPEKLESCLAVPFQSFAGKALYPGLVSQAAILFYLLIKNHPFLNGNKRIAVMALLVFLYMNGKWLTVDTRLLYSFTVWIAQSPAELHKSIVKTIEEFLQKHMDSTGNSKGETV